MIKKSRLDLYLLKSGLCETRQKAQGLILAGKVRDINGKVWDKPGPVSYTHLTLPTSPHV